MDRVELSHIGMIVHLERPATVDSCPEPAVRKSDIRWSCSAPGRIRTCGTRFRKPLLYPLSYGGARRSVRLVRAECAWWASSFAGRVVWFSWPPGRRAANPNLVATAPIVALSDQLRRRRRRRWRSRSLAGNGISGPYAEHRGAAHVHGDHGEAAAGCGPGKAAGGVWTLIDDQAGSRHRARGRRCGRAGDRGLWKQLG